MKKAYLFSILFLALLYSCTNNKNKYEKVVAFDQETFIKIEGEWAIINDWSDSLLTFTKKAENFKQEVFPTFNTIIFNQKNKTVDVNTYGEFGCGMAFIQNLKISHSKWDIKDSQLKLAFNYSDYSGSHDLENLYSIERKDEQLILKKIN